MTGTIRRGKVTRADLALWDGKNATHSRIDATGGTTSGLAIGNEVDVLQVFGSGSSRTRAAMLDAKNFVGSSYATLVFAPGTWTVDDDITIPSNLSSRVPAGCVFSVSSGKTLTFEGPVFIESSVWTAGAGNVSPTNSLGNAFRTSAEISAGIYPTDYTVREAGNILRYGTNTSPGTTDMTAAVQAACTVIPSNVGGVVYIPRGRYKVTSTISVKPKTFIYGEGWASSVEFTPSANGDSCFENALALAGPDGNIEFHNFALTLTNASSFHSSIGIDLRDRSGSDSEHASYCRIIGVKFMNWNLAAIYLDKSTVSFIDLCEFQSIKNIMYGTQAGVAWPILINGTGNGVYVMRCHVTDSDGFLRVAGAVTSASLSVMFNIVEASAQYANPSLAEHVFIEGSYSLRFMYNYLESLKTGPTGVGSNTNAVIRLDDVLGGDVSYNYIQSDHAGTDLSYTLIWVESGCQRIVITRNNLEDPINAYVQSDAADTQVFNNFYRFGGSVVSSVTSVRTQVSGVMLLELNEYAQTINYSASITPNFRAGKYIAVGTLTGALTVNEPSNPPSIPGFPRDIYMELTQDGTGGRNVTFNSIFSTAGGYSNTGNTSGTKCYLHWHWDGSNYRLISQRGWL